jgi:molecular chaperone HscB
MQSEHCWQCEHPAVESLFCKFCNSLQRPATDYYAFFGIARKLNLDEKDLQRRFYEMSRLLHPDRYTRRPEREREYSLEATAILNDGYRILRDPVRRAEYVLKDEGFEAAEQRTKDVPPELLEEVFELNMALEESDSSELGAFRDKFELMQNKIDDSLGELFARWDEARSRETLAEIRGVLNRRKYISNLLQTIHGHLSN